ncbi:MAG: hypothetical protein K0U93_29670 [Gammaproteobacteria bacterium]|nr:hypothetical protein [Gammaproteobacteria bacterium]
MSERTFTATDDRFHFEEMGDDWWATETAWFSFHNTERNLGGWFYTMARPNIGTIAGGAWIWDHTAHLPWEVTYSANYTALPIPGDQDLDDISLPTGVSIKVIEPCTSYALNYADQDRLTAALRFDAVMPPEPLTATGSTFGSAHHFDQFGRVSGELNLHGERIAIDCLSMRDRTWGRRPENRPRQAAYVTGMANPDHGFLAVTNVRPEGDLIAYGFLRLNGRTVSLAGGERRVQRDPEHGWITRIELVGKDKEGRELHAVGESVSRIFINRHTFIDLNSLVRWTLNGEEAWGEDQDMWPMHRWSRTQRENGFAV